MLFIALFIGILIIVLTGKLVQAYKLSVIFEVIGQICAALLIIMIGKLDVSYINMGILIKLGFLTIPFTILFLISLTNVMNVEKEQNNSILLLPFISFICFSLLAYFTGDSFVFITGIGASLTTILILLINLFSGRGFVGRTLTTPIGFVIAVLSISIIQSSIVAIYVPIFTLALPLTHYNYLQGKLTREQSTSVSSLTAMFFGVLMFIIPSNIMWILLVALTILLVSMQISRKHRFI